MAEMKMIKRKILGGELGQPKWTEKEPRVEGGRDSLVYRESHFRVLSLLDYLVWFGVCLFVWSLDIT
ncbi:hypothetical protein IGI04_032242 [Brassica rapa subsp. trilocularis]|uniref:Uncharacterized protein n=1 Tax=Brassica rapa subsp. trilocularis TaxID=1813537 RepID=A0ABQ7LYF4_BRACM|nr:hypothetical protein IGI04_032242 [Brassica rapa subsp. trilocularis]